MRPIKFRLWNTDRNKWIDDFVVHPKTGRPEVFCTDLGSLHLMQYTGLKDKNGKDIYEGDVVKADDYPASVIVYMEPLCCFVGSDRFVDDGSYYFNMWEPSDIHVIGNIYENPGLLEKC